VRVALLIEVVPQVVGFLEYILAVVGFESLNRHEHPCSIFEVAAPHRYELRCAASREI
jgi:hypothetical protein